MQLLPSWFLPPQDINAQTLPSGWYHKKNQTDETWLNTTLVSRLRHYTRWKHSPTFGHQARNSSAASLWLERDDALSPEALLAEQVSLYRRWRQREDGAAKESTDTKRRRQSEPFGDEPKRRRFYSSRHLWRLRKSEDSAFSPFGPRLEALGPRGRFE